MICYYGRPASRYRLELDQQLRVFGGIANRKVMMARLEVMPSSASRWASKVDIRDWGASLGSRALNKNKPPPLEPIGRSVTLSDEQWKVLYDNILDLVPGS